ncbi:uncharacterized protein LOC113750884 isoform X2 [Coffea eugenioides]|uniref:Uncharacterized protein isoform X2 n=1 Tax=Coffea arabica TaxID=13443 RepID=A0ABM4VZY2_COFAR|nr:uncharacterized protein LOC113750884 isoform X2 [Coffea eugenioides]
MNLSSLASSFLVCSVSSDTSRPLTTTFAANQLCLGPGPIIRLKSLRTATQIPKRRTIHRHRSFPFMASSGGGAAAAATATSPKWAQKTITIPPQRRGCHLITSKHTSASLTINENYDSDVRDDTETFLNRVVPEGTSAPWKHTLEGPDDMPAHIKSSMFGCTLTIPITNGKLNMGTWQGIWLCEHRDFGTARQIVVTLNGL